MACKRTEQRSKMKMTPFYSLINSTPVRLVKIDRHFEELTYCKQRGWLIPCGYFRTVEEWFKKIDWIHSDRPYNPEN